MASRSSRLIDVYVGRRARERRLELGLSCEVVAKMVSLSPEAVRDFEVGSLRLEPAELADVAAALQIPVRYFYCETKQDESSQGVDARRLQAFGPQLIPPAARHSGRPRLSGPDSSQPARHRRLRCPVKSVDHLTPFGPQPPGLLGMTV